MTIVIAIAAAIVAFLAGRWSLQWQLTRYVDFPGGCSCEMGGKIYWLLTEDEYIRLAGDARRIPPTGEDEPCR